MAETSTGPFAALTTPRTSTPNLDAKLAELLWEPPDIEKGTEGQAGTRRFKYANLLAVMTPLRPELKRLKLSWRTKPMLREDGLFVVRWRITDLDSGECDTGDYPVEATAPQARGSEITYASRYSLVNVTGVTPEGDDDDAAAAQKSRKRQAPHPDVPELAAELTEGAVPGVTRSRPTRPQPDAWSGAKPGDKFNRSQAGRFWAGIKRLGYGTDDRDAVLALVGGWVGRKLESTTELVQADADKVFNCLQAEEDRRRDPEWTGAAGSSTPPGGPAAPPGGG
jgi:hypothetical protein